LAHKKGQIICPHKEINIAPQNLSVSKLIINEQVKCNSNL
jgi:hypothetical protein